MAELAFARPDIGELEIAGVAECLRSGWLTSGAKVREFEAAFAAAVGAAHAVSCNSATTAALLLLEALGVGPGDEVVVPAWTFSGPAMMAHKLGARVVLCDIDKSDFNMTVRSLHAVVTERTKLVMPTHFAGRSCDMAALGAYCRARGLLLVDDAAHAFPTFDADGSPVGDQGAIASFFSFYATKTLTTGEGGMVVTQDRALAQRLAARRSHGISRDVFDRYTNAATGWRYDVAGPGWKANLTDLAAAIGLAQLSRSGAMHLARCVVSQLYDTALAEPEGHGRVIRPAPEDGHAWHLYPLRVLSDRDGFITRMAAQGVQCSVHFIPLHHHSFWRDVAGGQGRGLLGVADELAGQEVSLPIYSTMTLADVTRVSAAVRHALADADRPMPSGPC